MNILVTGANGQLGKELQRIVGIYGNGHTDHTTADKNYYIFATHKDLDITNENDVKEFVSKNKINVIVNCAAYTNVDKAETDGRIDAIQVNAMAPLYLAKAAKQNGCVLIHISTDFVFDGKKNIPYLPDDDCFPKSQYGITKYNGETNIRTTGGRYLIFRTSWLYSALSKNNFVYKIYSKLKNSDEKLHVVNDEIGNPTNARDLAKFIYHIIEDNTAENRYLSKNGVYHFANKLWTDRFVFARFIEHCMTEWKNGIDERVFPIKGKPDSIRPKYSALDVSDIKKEFDYEIPNSSDSLADAMDEIISGDLIQNTNVVE